MIIKKITAAAAVLAMLADSFSAVSVTGKAAEIPEPVWSADFESVVTDQDHVVEVSPNRGYAQVVDHDQKGFDMTVERSYNGTKALRINGDDYLTITGENGTAPITGSDTGVTLNYWVKVNGGSVSWSFFEKKDATVTKDRYYLGMINNSSKLRWETQNYRNNAVETTSNNLGSTWHMVSATYGEDGSFVYLDGKPVASKPDAWAAYGPLDGMIGDQPTAYIGYAQSWGEHAELSLDNYKIFDQQLSANQIAAIYEGEMSSLKTGVYLDGKEMKDFDTAMNQVIGDPTGTEHTISVYSDCDSGQISWFQDHAANLTIQNGEGGAAITQNNASCMLRISAQDSAVNLGKREAGSTDEFTALTMDARQKGRVLDMQSAGGTVNLYHGMVLTNGVDSRGGGLDNKSGTVNIYGGRICRNTATGSIGGGGVDVLGNSSVNGVVNMYGGEITENTSAMNRGGGAAVSEKGTFNMYGGRIFGNTGYDVYVGNKNFSMAGDAYAGNIYLADGTYINVLKELSSGSGHGMIKPERYADGKVVVKYADGVAPDASDFFVMSDGKQAYTLAVQGQDLVLEQCERSYIQNLYETACAYPTAKEGAAYIRDELTIGDPYGVTENLTLPEAREDSDGFSLTWASSDESVISNSGKVNRPARGRKQVTLTATIRFKGVTLTRDIEVVVNGTDVVDYTLTVSNKKGVDIPNGMYGLFFEDINFSADGGLYAELIENRSFESVEILSGYETRYDGLNEWSSTDTMTLRDQGGLNENNPHYLEFTGTSFRNNAYDGIYMEKGKTYEVSFYAKAEDYDGTISASAGGNSVVVAPDGVTGEWKQYKATLTASENVRKVPFTITLSKAGTIDFDMISVIPGDAVLGVFRKDLAEKLKALKPGFLRFPGGCIVEGGTIENYYDWKASVGPVEERKQNFNKWGSYGGKADHYGQTLGIGYYEYFQLCEYLECKPMPILNVGLACQNIYHQSLENQKYPISSREFQALVQDAVDLVAFANGTDFSNPWAALRRDMGHPKPFGLEMIGIGNEQWDNSDSQYYERYTKFEQAIHAAYPEIKLIGCVMGSDKSKVWDWGKKQEKTNPNYLYALDEHGYNSAEWFYQNTDYYDSYDRDTKIKVFYGEYAARSSARSTKINCLDTALSIAACMTGLERNADIVEMASYAPLFARNGYTQWGTDMIYFDDQTSYGTPEYYVQNMFGNHMGDYTLQNEWQKEGVSDGVYQTVSFDQENGELIAKLVNSNTTEQVIEIAIDKAWTIAENAKAKLTVMTHDSLDAVNSIDHPDNVAPTEKETAAAQTFRYTMPKQSVVVMRIPVAETEIEKGLGDMNQDGKITAVDALMALQAQTSGAEPGRGDVNHDGVLDTKDVLAILQVASGRKKGYL